MHKNIIKNNLRPAMGLQSLPLSRGSKLRIKAVEGQSQEHMGSQSNSLGTGRKKGVKWG